MDLLAWEISDQGRHRALGAPRGTHRRPREGDRPHHRHEALHARRRDHPRSLRGRVGGQLGLRPDDARRSSTGWRRSSSRSWCPSSSIFVVKDGVEVGFLLALPDLNEIIRHLNGRLFPFGFLKLIRNRRKVSKARILAMGIRREMQGRGLDAFLYHAITTERPRDGDPPGRAVLGARDEHRDEQHVPARRVPALADVSRSTNGPCETPPRPGVLDGARVDRDRRSSCMRPTRMAPSRSTTAPGMGTTQSVTRPTRSSPTTRSSTSSSPASPRSSGPRASQGPGTSRCGSSPASAARSWSG